MLFQNKAHHYKSSVLKIFKKKLEMKEKMQYKSKMNYCKMYFCTYCIK